MRILLTGAFGNLGSLVLERLLADGHSVTAFDVPTAANRSAAREFDRAPGTSITWGDLRDVSTVADHVRDCEAIVHVAAVIAPFSERNPTLAHAVNVEGTRSLLDLAVASGNRPLFVFTSSVSVFGVRQDDPPPRHVEEPVVATDHYSAHKIEGEQLVRASGLPFVILRLGAMVDERLRHSDPQQARLAFRLAADNRVEYVHPRDAALAIAHALVRPEARGRTFLIGGGPACQVRHIDLLNALTESMGIPMRPEDFGTEKLYADWLDTAESERILAFQTLDFATFRATVRARHRIVRLFVRPFAPLIRWLLRKVLAP